MISIIVPVYGVEKYLDRCITSIVNQTYKELEIILVDDGSLDKCPQMCDEWAKKDQRIRVIHKENGGLSDARNAGLQIAKGKYIGFVDSDDYIAPDMYECLLGKIEESKADLAICNYEMVDEKNSPFYSEESPIKDEILTRSQSIKKLAEGKWWYYITVWNKLYSRKSLKGVEFPVGKIHEDQFVGHKIYCNCETVVCISRKMYFYVQRSNSIMSAQKAIGHLDSVEALCERIDFFMENNLEEYCTGVRGILHQEYQGMRYKSTTPFLSEKEKKRVKEIDNMFRTYYLEQTSSVKEKIKYSLPQAYFLFLKLKNKILLKYRMKVLKNLMQYAIGSKFKDVILLDTPIHGNLGDQAIALTEIQYLKDMSIKAYELTGKEINYQEKKYATITSKNKIILVHGGGFLGSLWPIEEERFRRILQAFKHQKIVVFPQTVTFDMETESGRAYLKESQAIYSSHPDLTIFVREKKSFEFMEKYFPKMNCKLVPDIVTMLQTDVKIDDRQGILLCLRKDIERNINESDIERIVQSLKKKFPEEKIEYTDTVVDRTIFPSEREIEVNDKLQQFAKSKLIITDRLHGMIFAAITGTPCIALSNSNGKVQNVYEWIKYNEYIFFAKDIKEVSSILEHLDCQKTYAFDRKRIKEEFKLLDEEMRKITDGK